jgi:hypothetical protein
MAFNNVNLYLHLPNYLFEHFINQTLPNLLHKGYLLNVLSINNTIHKHLKHKNTILSNI